MILGDQTKKATVSWCYTPSGTKVPVPPIPPDGLIWDMAKGRFVPREKYARDKGYRLVTSNGKKLIDPTSSPKFREELAKLVRESLQHSQVATLDSGERILVLL